MQREYERVRQLLSPSVPGREDRMRALVDAIWEVLSDTGVSWAGFYLPDTTHPDQLVLGPMRDKPACSPIGMHGACGRAYRERRPLIVRDVQRLGESYIACDPRDRSEVVVPCLAEEGACWGVLDLDSFDVNAFDEDDAAGLQTLLVESQLSDPQQVGARPIVV